MIVEGVPFRIRYIIVEAYKTTVEDLEKILYAIEGINNEDKDLWTIWSETLSKKKK